MNIRRKIEIKLRSDVAINQNKLSQKLENSKANRLKVEILL